MNLVIDDAVEVQLATKTVTEERRQLGKLRLAVLHLWSLKIDRTNTIERGQCFSDTTIAMRKKLTPRLKLEPTTHNRKSSTDRGRGSLISIIASVLIHLQRSKHRATNPNRLWEFLLRQVKVVLPALLQLYNMRWFETREAWFYIPRKGIDLPSDSTYRW